MAVCFTVCSNNYLGQAKTLGDSVLQHHPSATMVIGLVDRLADDVDYSAFEGYHLIPAEQLGVANFSQMVQRYDIVELNTAMKGPFFQHLLDNYPDEQDFVYFDPDIMLFAPIAPMLAELDRSDVLLTPHITSPIEFDGACPEENLFLNYGIYNLGFLAVRRSDNARALIDWWSARTLEHGQSDVCEGFFVDQLWMNLAPLMFDRVGILKAQGYNAAPWNLHERRHITPVEDGFQMPDGSPLTFFHFSSYKPARPDVIAPQYSRYNFENCPDLRPLYERYHQALLDNHFDQWARIPCHYMQVRQRYRQRKPGYWPKKVARWLLGFFPRSISKRFV